MNLHIEVVISHWPRMRNDEFNVQTHASLHEYSHIDLVISHSRQVRNDEFNVLRFTQASMNLNIEVMAVCGVACGVLCVVCGVQQQQKQMQKPRHGAMASRRHGATIELVISHSRRMRNDEFNMQVQCKPA